jgi:hypothetical protein
MWHVDDVLAIAVALVVILVILSYGDLLGNNSLLRRTILAPVRALRREPGK